MKINCECLDRVDERIWKKLFPFTLFRGTLSFMAVKKDGKVHVQAGAGIVEGSVPDKEYIEVQNKARAVMEALERAGEADER